VPASFSPPSGRSRKAWTASVNSSSTSTCARASSRLAHGAARDTCRYPPNPRRSSVSRVVGKVFRSTLSSSIFGC
jgi:hypothetical protein